MRICLICEGCYPYVRGGVSNWVHNLILSFPDIEFALCTIGTSKSSVGEPKYEIPENVKEAKDLFLDLNHNISKDKVKKLSKLEQKALKSFLTEDFLKVDWNKTINRLSSHNRASLIYSEAFYEAALEQYKSVYEDEVFADFIWTLRSTYLPLFSFLTEDIPKADLYHCVSTGYAGALGSIAGMRYKTPLLVTEHGIYTREREEEIIRADWVHGNFKDVWIDYFKRLSKIAYDTAENIIALSPANFLLQESLGCKPDKLLTIPNGVDLNRLKKCKGKLEEDEGRYNIGALIRFVPIKDIVTMVLAFEEVQHEIKNAHLYLMGPTDEDPEYFDECSELIKNIPNIHVTGSIDIVDYVGRMDIMLLTSISEGQPLSVLETMAVGVPQVCTNVGCCKELLAGNEDDSLGQAGIITPVMNASEIAEALILLYQDKPRRERMSKVAALRVEKYYQKSGYIDEYARLYTKYAPKGQVIVAKKDGE